MLLNISSLPFLLLSALSEEEEEEDDDDDDDDDDDGSIYLYIDIYLKWLVCKVWLVVLIMSLYLRKKTEKTTK